MKRTNLFFPLLDCIGTGQVVTGDIECEAGKPEAVCLSNGGLAVQSAVFPAVRRHRRASL